MRIDGGGIDKMAIPLMMMWVMGGNQNTLHRAGTSQQMGWSISDMWWSVGAIKQQAPHACVRITNTNHEIILKARQCRGAVSASNAMR